MSVLNWDWNWRTEFLVEDTSLFLELEHEHERVALRGQDYRLYFNI